MILVDTFRHFRKIGWFLPGFILYAAFPPMCEVSDVLFALAPLLWLVRQGNPKNAAKRCFQSGLLFWVATLAWMPAIVKNGGPWPLVVLGWFALAAYCASYFAAFGALAALYWKWARQKAEDDGTPVMPIRLFGILLVEPVLWAGLEIVRSRFMGGFSWNQLGVVPANAGFGAPAAVGGVYLLSAVVILINGTFAGIAERVIANVRAKMRRDYEKSALSPWRSLETALALGLVFAVYSLTPENPLPTPETKGATTLKVAMVQRNFSCVFKDRDETEDPYAVYSNLLQSVALVKPDLVVLSESALSEFGAIGRARAFSFARWASEQSGGAAILAGGTRFEGERCYNSAALYDFRHSGLNFATYDKVHLIPFGEYIPGDKVFPILQKLAPVGSCTPGGETLLAVAPSGTTNAIPFAVAICFEDTDSALLRRQAAHGAKFLAFIENDNWFSYSNETLAHAWQATARAIETGLPVVRTGNSGATETIRPDGTVSRLVGSDGRLLLERAGVLCDRIIVANRGPTPYVRIGDVPILTMFFILVAGIVWPRLWYRRRANSRAQRDSRRPRARPTDGVRTAERSETAEGRAPALPECVTGS